MTSAENISANDAKMEQREAITGNQARLFQEKM